MFCFIGALAARNNVNDLWTIVAFGAVGYLFEKFRFPIAPMVLGAILGPLAESYFLTTMISARERLDHLLHAAGVAGADPAVGGDRGVSALSQLARGPRLIVAGRRRDGFRAILDYESTQLLDVRVLVPPGLEPVDEQHRNRDAAGLTR